MRRNEQKLQLNGTSMEESKKRTETSRRQKVAAAAAEIRRLREKSLYRALPFAEDTAKKWPASVTILMLLAELRAEIGAYELAQKAYAAAFKLDPKNVAVLTSMGRTLASMGKLDAAVQALSQAIKTKPDNADAYRELAEILFLKGDHDPACNALHASLKYDPENGSVHRRLAVSTKYLNEDKHVKTIASLISKAKKADTNLANLHFAYAKAMEDLSRPEIAFEHYVKGGRIQKAVLGYSINKDVDLFSQLESTQSGLLGHRIDMSCGPKDVTPIFILGMPRSGTTLLEQITSSHSDVTAGGEINQLTKSVSYMLLNNTEVEANLLSKLREGYLSYVGRRANGVRYITDKMPHNFRNVSLISKCFPEAKIVHVSRDPRATCWSNFKHFFTAAGLGYSWDIDDTVAFYNMYLDLMDFHREHMVGEMIEVQYEDLVADPDTEIRKLIAALGLDWQDACLEPQKNKRAVRTASQMQVQKGIYKGSSEGWRKFEPYLAEAFSKLKGLPPEA